MTRKSSRSAGGGRKKSRSLGLSRQTLKDLNVPNHAGEAVKGGEKDKRLTITCKGDDCRSYQCMDTYC
jgi:hypothetical protein